MKFKGRFWKKSFYSKEVSGPYEFVLEATSNEEAVQKAIDLIVRVEVRLSASVVEKSELFIDGQWKEFDPKGLKQA